MTRHLLAAIIARGGLGWVVVLMGLGALWYAAQSLLTALRQRHRARKARRRALIRHPSVRLSDEQVFAMFADIALYYDLDTADPPEPRSNP